MIFEFHVIIIFCLENTFANEYNDMKTGLIQLIIVKLMSVHHRINDNMISIILDILKLSLNLADHHFEDEFETIMSQDWEKEKALCYLIHFLRKKTNTHWINSNFDKAIFLLKSLQHNEHLKYKVLKLIIKKKGFQSHHLAQIKNEIICFFKEAQRYTYWNKITHNKWIILFINDILNVDILTAQTILKAIFSSFMVKLKFFIYMKLFI